MAIKNFAGVETGDLSDFSSTSTSGSATVSRDTGTVRTGEGSLRVQATTTGSGYANLAGFGTGGQAANIGAADCHVRFYFRYATKPSSNTEEILHGLASSGSMSFSIRLDASGFLSLYNDSNTQLAIGATALSANTWYRIEVRVNGGSPYNYELKIDGTSEFSGSGSSTDFGTSIGNLRFGKAVNRNSQTIDYYYDDLCVDDAAFPGIGATLRLDVDGAGSHTAWSGSYTDVDETPAGNDGDTTFVSSSTSGQKFSSAFESSSSAGISGTINGVKVVAVVRDEGGATSLRVLARSGTTDSTTSANNDPGATYVGRTLLLLTDPNTGSAWTTGGLDGLEGGVQNNASVALRCTSITAYADFAAGGTVVTLDRVIPSSWLGSVVLDRVIGSCWLGTLNLDRSMPDSWQGGTLLDRVIPSSWKGSIALDRPMPDSWKGTLSLDRVIPSSWKGSIFLDRLIPSSWGGDGTVVIFDRVMGSSWRGAVQLDRVLPSSWQAQIVLDRVIPVSWDGQALVAEATWTGLPRPSVWTGERVELWKGRARISIWTGRDAG